MSKEDNDYILYIKQYFSNAEGGAIKANDLKKSLEDLNKPFLEKHKEYKENVTITIGEIDTTLDYKLVKNNEPGKSQTPNNLLTEDL